MKDRKRRGANPFETYDRDQSGTGLDQPLKVFTATSGSDLQSVKQREASSSIDPTPVAFPNHLFTPSTGQSIDLRKLISVNPATTSTIIDFTAPNGFSTKFIYYVLYTNAIDASTVFFSPTVNGRRVFPFHGDPLDNFKINLSITGDLGENGAIKAQLNLNAGDRLLWTFTNNSAAPVAAGVRVNGYADTSIISKSGRVGG